jgi:hypothetical protein
MMSMRDIRDLDKEDLLEALGLQIRPKMVARILTIFGTFGVGMIVGAGVALLFAPKAGQELRGDIQRKLKRGAREVESRLRMGQQEEGLTS